MSATEMIDRLIALRSQYGEAQVRFYYPDDIGPCLEIFRITDIDVDTAHNPRTFDLHGLRGAL